MTGKNTLVAALLLVLFLAGTALVSAAAQNDGAAPTVATMAEVNAQIQPLVSGLSSPVAVRHAGDGSGRLFIVEQSGRIKIWDGSQLLATPFLNVSSLITFGGERGLLGLDFHPDYAANGLFYVNYTDNSGGDTRIVEYQVSAADPNVADPGSARLLLEIDQPFTNHNGGDIHFGPDDYLYIGTGDGGSAGDPGNRAQNLNLLLGKMLRIDVNNNNPGDGLPYDIPPDNPFVGDPSARDEIWAYGLRNPWRFSFDRATGVMLIGDVGQNQLEEIDLELPSSPGGRNYGWRLMEGSECYIPSINCNDGTLVLPILEYSHTSGNCSVTGGYRYDGSNFPLAKGYYLYADYCSGRIWAANRASGGAITNVLWKDTPYLISSFGEDEAGELYFTDLNGTVYQFVP